MHVPQVNLHEVEMTAAVVKYMLQQNYRPNQLVVLTPYLGQLLELHKELRKSNSVGGSGQNGIKSSSLNVNRPRSSHQVTLGDLDMSELRKEAQPLLLSGLSSTVASSEQTSDAESSNLPAGIRVATIDNYQGEESDVVIASLVRCNDAGSVGFLKERQRINVLLSRARQGLIIIGSAATLQGAKNADARKHWGKVGS